MDWGSVGKVVSSSAFFVSFLSRGPLGPSSSTKTSHCQSSTRIVDPSFVGPETCHILLHFFVDAGLIIVRSCFFDEMGMRLPFFLGVTL